jgi:hypothetical protein
MADFYGTQSGFSEYCAARGYSVAGDAEIEKALLVASEFIDGRYTGPFVHTTRKTGERDQIREWPRQGVVDRYGYAVASDAVPREVVNATYEAAYRHLTGTTLVADYTKSEYRRVAVDGAVSLEYADVNASDIQAQFKIIDMILAPLIEAQPARSSGLSGAAVRL